MQEYKEKSVAETEEELLAEFAGMADEFDRYTWLMHLGGQLAGLPQQERTEERLFSGCLSRVWMDVKREEGRLMLRLDSDTLIVRGILFLIETLLNGRTLEEAALAQVTFLQRLELESVLNDSRKAGMGNLLAAIQSYAAQKVGHTPQENSHIPQDNSYAAQETRAGSRPAF